METCRTRATRRNRAALIPLCLLAILTLAACGGSSKSGQSGASSATPPASSAATSSAAATTSGPASAPVATLQGEAAVVAKAWETFFDGTTDAAQKTALLQNGDQFQQLIQAQAGSQIAQSVKAQVSDVQVSGDTATVSYSISIGGQQALGGQKGQAVKTNGKWQVSDASFCQLLALESGGDTSKLPPACTAGGTAGGTASPTA